MKEESGVSAASRNKAAIWVKAVISELHNMGAELPVRGVVVDVEEWLRPPCNIRDLYNQDRRYALDGDARLVIDRMLRGGRH